MCLLCFRMTLHFITVVIHRHLQLQAGRPQADLVTSAGSLRGFVFPDVLEEAEPDLFGPRADLLQGETLAGSAQAHGPCLQVCAHQGAAGEVQRYCTRNSLSSIGFAVIGSYSKQITLAYTRS